MEQLNNKYPGLRITARKRGDGLISWLFESPVRGKAVVVDCIEGMTPSLPPIVQDGWGIADFYKLHLEAQNGVN